MPYDDAHRGAAITGHVPRDADARREVPPLRVHARLAVGEARIAGIDEPGRRIREPLSS